LKPPKSARTNFNGLNDATFDSIDTDNSGALDEEELTRALRIASGVPMPQLNTNTNTTTNSTTMNTTTATSQTESSTPSKDKNSMDVLSRLASRLLLLYDYNGDGVVDREEYKDLITDMAKIRETQRRKQNDRKRRKQQLLNRRKRTFLEGTKPVKWGRSVGEAVSLRLNRTVGFERFRKKEMAIGFENAKEVKSIGGLLQSVGKCDGSIVFSDLKLDLRRLLVGGIPIIKSITPGGPLVLEPFTTTFTVSFDKNDMLQSGLLMDGLSRLVTRALRRRVRSVRDLVDGAVFYGRTWNMASKKAPLVELQEITDIEFDSKNRAIITGRARIRASPDQPVIENSFKLRTKLGTRDDGQVIGLSEPELALVLECPKVLERNIVSTCKKLNLPIPTRPEPLFTYIPLVSPVKKTEQDGFNLGEDNKIKSIYIKNGALRLELSFTLRPGRFLGNHYLAFTVPNRTFIITTDRVRNWIKFARRNKRLADMASQQDELVKKKMAKDMYMASFAQALSSSAIGIYAGDIDDLLHEEETIEDDHSFLEPKPSAEELEVMEGGSSSSSGSSVKEDVVPNKPGFFSRFLEGYLEAAREETDSERLTTAISEFFGSSDGLDGDSDSMDT